MAEICMITKLDIQGAAKENVQLKPIFSSYGPRKFFYNLSNLVIRAGNKGKKISMS